MTRSACPNCTCGFDKVQHNLQEQTNRTTLVRALSDDLRNPEVQLSISNLRERLKQVGIEIAVDGAVPYLRGNTDELCQRARVSAMQIISEEINYLRAVAEQEIEECDGG